MMRPGPFNSAAYPPLEHPPEVDPGEWSAEDYTLRSHDEQPLGEARWLQLGGLKLTCLGACLLLSQPSAVHSRQWEPCWVPTGVCQAGR